MIECVNTLYNATPRTCPARLLWADILALHGAPVDRLLNNPRHTSGKPKADVSGNRESNGALHPDLVWDVMSTSLRMVRRNLTLVCEMTTEGAWCERYHLHAKMGHNCYQELHKEDQERLEMEREKLDAKLAETADADRMDVDAEEYSEEE
ncbi:hypothetical protein P280DRAFT_468495 [Massarina eburnea CBS 473.64]|uniref:Uncharacterized protein n=1 Tax=Massarina eburnea CBS 473.64 TaxID=1395130 RepID=A0A6A6S394_9PLEO|nr:hypothetical protein P280DRAFT_468495 [Massarina eburnea CBS 473.64]